MTVPKQPKTPANTDEAGPTRKAITLTLKGPPETRDAALAAIAVDPTMTSATLATAFARGAFGDVSLEETAVLLGHRAAAVQAGDLSSAESMLISQATALNSMFTEFSRRLAKRLNENVGTLGDVEVFHRMAMRTQSQCRMTLETLGALKNPPVMFREAGQHRQRAAADQQRRSRSHARSERPIRAQGTIALCQALGAPNDDRSRRRRSGAGGPGNDRRGREARPGRRARRETLTAGGIDSRREPWGHCSTSSYSGLRHSSDRLEVVRSKRRTRPPYCNKKMAQRLCPASPISEVSTRTLHGGLSTGPPTSAGSERSRRARWKHGQYSREAIEARRLANQETWEQAKARFAREERRRDSRQAREVREITRQLNRLLGRPR